MKRVICFLKTFAIFFLEALVILYFYSEFPIAEVKAIYEGY